MPLEPVEPGSVQDWLRHAVSDLAIARQPLPADALYEMLCFHTQQAVEKAIKAVLVANDVEVPYTHNIARLITTIKDNNISWPEGLDEAAALTEYAVQMRYPGPHREISKQEHEQALVIAEQVVNWAQTACT